MTTKSIINKKFKNFAILYRKIINDSRNVQKIIIWQIYYSDLLYNTFTHSRNISPFKFNEYTFTYIIIKFCVVRKLYSTVTNQVFKKDFLNYFIYSFIAIDLVMTQ